MNLEVYLTDQACFQPVTGSLNEWSTSSPLSIYARLAADLETGTYAARVRVFEAFRKRGKVIRYSLSNKRQRFSHKKSVHEHVRTRTNIDSSRRSIYAYICTFHHISPSPAPSFPCTNSQCEPSQTRQQVKNIKRRKRKNEK